MIDFMLGILFMLGVIAALNVWMGIGMLILGMAGVEADEPLSAMSMMLLWPVVLVVMLIEWAQD